MIAIQTLPAYVSLGLATLATASIFAWRYGSIRRDSLSKLFSLPTIGIAGKYSSATGKIMKSVAPTSGKRHMFLDNVGLHRIGSGRNQFQIVEFPPLMANKQGVENYDELIGKFDNMEKMLYVIDFNKSKSSIKSQIDAVLRMREKYPIKEITIVLLDADKKRDGKSLIELSSVFGKPHHVKSSSVLNKEKYLSHVKSERSDLRLLIDDLRKPARSQMKSH